MKKITLLLAVACLAVVGCDNKETRTGFITLTGSSNIPLVDKSGAQAELVSGPAEITFQKGSKNGTIAIGVKQSGRPDVNIEAPVNGDPRSGDFTLRGSDIGQPVDMISHRSYAVTGPTERWSSWQDMGFERCLVETSFDPCDENWTVAFHASAGDLGTFAAKTSTRCNERTTQSFCQQIPDRIPRYPDPRGHGGDRGGHGGIDHGGHGRGRFLDSVLSTDPSTLKFD